MKCFQWLDYCLKIGWPKSSLERLQELWWEYHDDEGNIMDPE